MIFPEDAPLLEAVIISLAYLKSKFDSYAAKARHETKNEGGIKPYDTH